MRWLGVGWIAAVVLCTGVQSEQCDVPVVHYKALGCTAVGTVAATGCPERYECPSLTARDNAKCYFNGKSYAIRERIPDELVAPFCTVMCQCRAASPHAKFLCAHIECPELFQRFDYANCSRKYEMGSCCATGMVCGEQRAKLATCELEHKIYREGQDMSLKDQPCRRCICKPGFNANAIATDPNCYEPACGFELFQEKQVYGGGIPVYKKDHCCPWEWRLPLETDKVAKGSDPAGSKQQCKYGKLTLNVGDSLDLGQSATNSDGSKLSCTCAIPPLVHCVLN